MEREGREGGGERETERGRKRKGGTREEEVRNGGRKNVRDWVDRRLFRWKGDKSTTPITAAKIMAKGQN